MKRLIIWALVVMVTALPAQAQNYKRSRYYNPASGRLDYRGGRPANGYWRPYSADIYTGMRIGAAFSTVTSDDKYLNGSGVKSGLNVGLATGFAVGWHAPLYFETGLYYTEKGGKGKAGDTKFTYNLDYLEVPLVLKYMVDIDRGLSLQPFLGGYLACGVGGKVKDFGQREAYSSFSNSPYSFRRFDGGVKMGCGLQYDMLYLDLTYDLGLSNVSDDDFDDCRNSALMLNVGINF